MFLTMKNVMVWNLPPKVANIQPFTIKLVTSINKNLNCQILMAYPMIGSWVVGDVACGIGLREDFTPVTGNDSHFIPHYFVE